MKNYKQITNKYFKCNKKKSVLTICGIILSIALITSIGLFMESIQNTFIKRTIREEGAFHIAIKNNTDKDYERIKNNPKIDKIGLRENFDKAYLKSSKIIELNRCDKTALELLPYKAIKGNLPNNSEEIILESWVLNYIENNPKIGDFINLELKNGKNRKFKLVGLIKNDSFNQFEGSALGITYSEKFDLKNTSMYITINKKAKICSTVKELKTIFKNANENKQLLDYMGESTSNRKNKAMYSTIAFIIAIVVIATIAVIYNSFQISVMERIKQFGLLRAIGATPKQIRKMVLREATIMSIIAIPSGLICGILALEILAYIFKVLSTSVFGDFMVKISFRVMIISTLVGLYSVYISALLPAMFAGKISPLVAISSRTCIVKEKIKKNRGRFLKKLLNINILMAFKNIKRNKKRFNTTVFSISLSVILYIVFSYFISINMNFAGMEIESDKSDFKAIGIVDKNNRSSLSNKLTNEIKNNVYVNEEILNYSRYISQAMISNNKRDKELENILPKLYNKTKFDGKDMTSLNAMFEIYSIDKLKKCKNYIVSGKINEEKMNKENGVVLVRKAILNANHKYYNRGLTNLKIGDTFYINKNFVKTLDENKKNMNFKNDNIAKLKVIAIVDEPPYKWVGSDDYLKIIVPKNIIKNISNKDISNIPIMSSEIILKDKNNEEQFQKWIQILGDKSGIKIINNIQQSKERKNCDIQLKILMYGFISVISLIGAVNIINTLTTNIILRKKEIASLSAIGMTYKNIRIMILTEGILYGLYGCVIGSVVGSVLTYFMSSPLRKLVDFKWTIPWQSITVALLVAMFIGIIAVIEPLAKIKKENIIDVIRNEE